MKLISRLNLQTSVIVSQWWGGLELDEKIFNFLKARNIVSASALVSFLIAVPDALVKNQILTEAQRDIFKENVWSALVNILPDSSFNPTPHLPRGMGALKPTKNE